jgi:hypothetical protein
LVARANVHLKQNTFNSIARAREIKARNPHAGIDVEDIISEGLHAATIIALRVDTSATAQREVEAPVSEPRFTIELSHKTAIQIEQARKLGVDVDGIIYNAVEDGITREIMRNP